MPEQMSMPETMVSKCLIIFWQNYACTGIERFLKLSWSLLFWEMFSWCTQFEIGNVWSEHIGPRFNPHDWTRLFVSNGRIAQSLVSSHYYHSSQVRSARTATNWAELRKCCWQIVNVGSVPRILVFYHSLKQEKQNNQSVNVNLRLAKFTF